MSELINCWCGKMHGPPECVSTTEPSVAVSEEPGAKEQPFPLGLTEYQAVNLRWALDEIRQGSPLNTGDWVCEIMLALEGMDLQSEPNGYSVAPAEPVESEPRRVAHETRWSLLAARVTLKQLSDDLSQRQFAEAILRAMASVEEEIPVAEPKGAREAEYFTGHSDDCDGKCGGGGFSSNPADYCERYRGTLGPGNRIEGLREALERIAAGEEMATIIARKALAAQEED